MTSTVVEAAQAWLKRAALCLLLLSLADGRVTSVDEDVREHRSGSKTRSTGLERGSVVQLSLERKVLRTGSTKRDDEAGTHAIGLGDSQDVYVVFLSFVQICNLKL